VKLVASLVARLEAHIDEKTVRGNRYSAQSRTEVYTEEFG
jgi:hypothetical protein